MVGHAWWSIHIPFTNSYVPIWVVGGLLLLILLAVLALAAIVASFGNNRRLPNS